MLGRGFEILPVATGDLEALLDGLSEETSGLDCFTLGGQKFEMPRSLVNNGESQGGGRKRMDEGPRRAIQAAQQVVEQRKPRALPGYAQTARHWLLQWTCSLRRCGPEH